MYQVSVFWTTVYNRIMLLRYTITLSATDHAQLCCNCNPRRAQRCQVLAIQLPTVRRWQPVRRFGGQFGRVTLCVCLFVCPHDKGKTTRAVNTKFGRHQAYVVHDRPLKCIVPVIKLLARR